MAMYERRATRQIHIGNIPIGGGAPISVQSMCNTKTTDTEATVQQIRELAAAGCDIVRVAVPDMAAAKNLGNIVRQVKTPLVADIHFDYKLALEAMAQGVAALRINPGNIGGTERVKKVVAAAREGGIPIRIGVNAGSLDHKMLTKYGGITAEALVASAMEHVRVLEELDFYDMKISLKAHDVPLTLAAYRLMSERVDYPLHLGITEAGTAGTGIIKSSVGVGALLAEGIGDTIRISLTGDPGEGRGASARHGRSDRGRGHGLRRQRARRGARRGCRHCGRKWGRPYFPQGRGYPQGEGRRTAARTVSGD